MTIACLTRRFILSLIACGLVGCTGPTATGGSLAGAPAASGDSKAPIPTPGPADGLAEARSASVPAPVKVAEVEGIVEYRLHNGLRVLLFQDPSQAHITVNITYFVGSRHEGYGESGMAHLLEHMVFKGTPKHPDILTPMEERGAAYSGTTWVDRTNYFETLPATDDNLSFAIGLEADRMVNSRIAKEDLASEFSVVRNEFERNENFAWRVLRERMNASAYLWHNYGKSTIGSKSDIERVPVEALRAFYKRYYQPDNAMLVIAGRFQPERALALVNQHFGAIARPERKLLPTYTDEPVQDGERTVILRRAGDVGMVGVMYHAVPGAHEDQVGFEALASMLTAEPSGPLYAALIKTGMATNLYGSAYPTADPGNILFMAEVPAGKPLEPVRDKLLAIVEGAGAETGRYALTDEHLRRFKSGARKDFTLMLSNSRRTAFELSDWAAIGDWRMMFINRDRRETLDLARVKRAAKSYLKRSNRTLGMYVPTKAPARVPDPEAPDVLALTRDYRGKAAMSVGEAFDSSLANVIARTQTATLENGMRLALIPKETRGDAVQLVFYIQTGSANDFRRLRTADSLVAPMLMRGTRKHTYKQLRDELDRLQTRMWMAGSELDGAPGSAYMVVSTTRAHLLEVIALAAEIWRQPRFDAREFEIVREERLAARTEEKNEPMTVGRRWIDRKLSDFKERDIRHVPTYEREIADLKRAKLADVRSVHQRLWGMHAGGAAVVGDFDAREVEQALREHFGDWRGQRPYRPVAYGYRATAAENQVIATPDKKNAFVAMGTTLEVRDDHPDYAALALIMHLTAEARTSRLWDALRSKGGLSYRVHGYLSADALERSGSFTTTAICAASNAEKALGMMRAEWARLIADGVTEKELESAKKGWLQAANTSRAMDLPLAADNIRAMSVGRTLAYHQVLEERVAALTVAEVNRVIRTYLSLDRTVSVRAGDFAGR